MPSAVSTDYVRFARQIVDFGIWERPHHYVKLWLWLLCNFKDRPVGDYEGNRVSVAPRELEDALRTYAGNGHRYLSCAQFKFALDWMEEQNMITIERFPGRFLIGLPDREAFEPAKAHEEAAHE